MKDYLEQQDIFDDGAFFVADGAYSGEENSQIAASHNLKLVTTNFTSRKPDEIYADFKFSYDGHLLLECINGCTPSECIYDPGNDRSVAYFKTEECGSCPYKERCQPRFLKTRVRKEVSWKSVGRAKQLQYMKTEESVSTLVLETEWKQFPLFCEEDIMQIKFQRMVKIERDFILDLK